MTATDELRRLLDERGVEYSECADVFARETYWQDETRKPYRASESVDNGGELTVRHLTPEQAIAATLGSSKLTAEQVWRAVDQRSVCVPEKGDKEWQAIADELNATLGGGECEMRRDEHGVWHCLSCEKGADKVTGNDGELESWHDSWPPNFCPYCGKKVVEQ